MWGVVKGHGPEARLPGLGAQLGFLLCTLDKLLNYSVLVFPFKWGPSTCPIVGLCQRTGSAIHTIKSALKQGGAGTSWELMPGSYPAKLVSHWEAAALLLVRQVQAERAQLRGSRHPHCHVLF